MCLGDNYVLLHLKQYTSEQIKSRVGVKANLSLRKRLYIFWWELLSICDFSIGIPNIFTLNLYQRSVSEQIGTVVHDYSGTPYNGTLREYPLFFTI